MQQPSAATHPWPQTPLTISVIQEVPCPCFRPHWLLLHAPFCSFFRWLAPSLHGLWASPGPLPQTARPGQPPWHLLRLLLLLPPSNTLSSGSPPQPTLGTAHLLCPGMWDSNNQTHTLLSSSPNLLRHLESL